MLLYCRVRQMTAPVRVVNQHNKRRRHQIARPCLVRGRALHGEVCQDPELLLRSGCGQRRWRPPAGWHAKQPAPRRRGPRSHRDGLCARSRRPSRGSRAGLTARPARNFRASRIEPGMPCLGGLGAGAAGVAVTEPCTVCGPPPLPNDARSCCRHQHGIGPPPGWLPGLGTGSRYDQSSVSVGRLPVQERRGSDHAACGPRCVRDTSSDAVADQRAAE